MSLSPRTLSGMRPTGPLHIGHYFGAINNWLKLQSEMPCYFFVADWHALTSDYANTNDLKEFVIEMARDWLACGLNPEQSVIFQQSLVLEHAELSLLLGMITPVSWLERNPTYKEQREEITNKDLGNLGFLGYPVLMASDILMYRPAWVPVGEDQLPHLELTREIARRFNNFYGDFFPEPQARLTPAARCPGLDGRKMSKSYGNAIFLSDDFADVAKKVRGMLTDKNRLRRNDPGDPNICNLFPYHELLADEDARSEICQGCVTATLGCVDCKKILIDNLEKFLIPIQEKRETLSDDYIRQTLNAGSQRAREEARRTMQGVRKSMNMNFEY